MDCLSELRQGTGAGNGIAAYSDRNEGIGTAEYSDRIVLVYPTRP